MALLLGYGAAAINPYLAFETIEDLIDQGVITGITKREAVRNFVKASTKGVLKIMSKMGISTVASYTGAQVFEAIGLSEDVVDEYFTGTTSRIGGVGLDVLAEEVAARHRFAYLDRPEEAAHRDSGPGGEYQWRREGEYHLFNPETVFKLQHATRTKRYDVFKEYTARSTTRPASWPRCAACSSWSEGGARRCRSTRSSRSAEIVKRFSTGAMSYGSISKEAHETLAIAMNRIGGKSNTGEGGEDPERRLHDPERRSAVKQVASGRFGVTSEYLTNADDLQIKMAQGAKPGEGGQLPGNKVYPWIAKTRHSTPGVGLISPAAAPRHLLHRGPQAAHPRPEERQPVGPRPREARGRGRRGHGGRRRVEGQGRRGAHLRPRRRHRAPARSPRSSTPARPGSSAWPRRSRRCCSTACATASSCRPTAS